MSQKYLPCDFHSGFDFFALIDCLGVKLLDNYGVNFFEPLTKFFELLLKTMPILCLFGTVNINKVVSPDKNCTFTVHFTTFVIVDIVRC